VDQAAWNERYRTTEYVWKTEPNQFLVEEVRDLPPGRALDVACGEGRNAVWLAQQGWHVTGVDFSSVALEKARHHAKAHDIEVGWIEADLNGWEPELESFDLVVLAYVHQPAKARRILHRRMVSALRPGGRLLIIAHDSTNLDGGVGGPQDPLVLFSPDDVVADVAGLNLETERSLRVTRMVATETGERAAIDALVRLRKREEREEGDKGEG